VGIAYRCDASLGCTFVVWDGDVTPQQWADQVQQIVTDPAFPPGPLMLGDLSTTGGAPSITTDAIEEMAARWRTAVADVGPMRWALIPGAAWDKVRQFDSELEASGVRMMVFNEAWSACKWLGVDADAARTILNDLREQLRAPAT
jgi:hypothetical protein